MKVIIFGATGMVGQGVLRECLLDPDVESVLAIVRKSSLPHTSNFAKSYIKMFLISRRLRTVSQATTHVSSASASRQWG
jgi:aspartate-semialdehyde dehydrogenase